jgi:hypothetical protein
MPRLSLISASILARQRTSDAAVFLLPYTAAEHALPAISEVVAAAVTAAIADTAAHLP